VYHLFPVRTTRRQALQAHLRTAGIETLVHYPVAVSRQAAFAQAGPAACPKADIAVNEVLSLPLHPALPPTDVMVVADTIRAFAGTGDDRGKELTS
jgi:dTDP-4-amino-4,6-dideoxygalactose transaminase